MKEELVAIGKIVKAQGIKGEVKVFPLTDFTERFDNLKKVILEKENGETEVCTVESSRAADKFFILKLSGINDRNSAETYEKAWVSIEKEDLLDLEEGSFYTFELTGMEVFDKHGEKVGTLNKVERYPANDVLVIETETEYIYAPALRKVLVKIDKTERKLILDLPEGLPSIPRK